jgi:hypothetical protein
MLKHEHPPGYGPRQPRYPKLGPYIPAIERLLHSAVSGPPTTDLTIRQIVERLRCEQGFGGSYESVRNYIRRLRGNENPWERAYDLVVRLPKARALDFIRLLSQDDPSALTSQA